MKKIALIFGILVFTACVFAGFKVKNIKPKKPERFQSRMTIAGVTFAADLVFAEKDQKDYFCKELASSGIIAVRMAVYNNGDGDVILPLGDLELQAPDGKIFRSVSAEFVVETVLGEPESRPASRSMIPAVVAGGGRPIDRRGDRTNPNYDPRLDPGSPDYDPNDPRNRGKNPPGTYPSGGTHRQPGIVLYPGGSGKENLSKYERQLVEKDFSDKTHTADPISKAMHRDRFIYFSINESLSSAKGYFLRLPSGKGIPQEVILKF